MVTSEVLHVLNMASGKPSYLILNSDANEFSNQTNVMSIKDTKNNFDLDFDVLKNKSNANHLQIRLKGKKQAQPAPDPTPGSLTITLNNPPATISGVMVVYVNDDGA
jgi:hypothetical protein